MNSFKSLAMAAALCAAPIASNAAEIIAIPGDFVFAHDANPGKGYRDLMVQTLVIHNDGEASATLTGLQIDVLSASGGHLSKQVPMERLLGQTREFAGMAGQGFAAFLNAQLLEEEGLAAAIAPDVQLARDARLAPGAALIATAHYIAVDFDPKSIVITATLADEDNQIKTATRRLSVRRREYPVAYIAPLKGAWLARGYPSIESHHRYIPSNEFAIDFFKTGENGSMDKGERLSAEDDYGYGAPVYAVADGEVVFVLDGEVQDPEALSRGDGESIEAARQRITQYQMRRFAQDFRAAAAGNMITIRHEADGVVEYSNYAHLKPESINVKAGDRVRQGEAIAAVGNTGDSTLTHLHFQINAGADAFHSRSLPVSFTNSRSLYVGQDQGRFLRFEE
ncbi:MAG: M23 family metallopeptidase [Pseudomonadota bacterium]